MPFKSLAQMKYLYSQEPAVAKEYASHTKKKTYSKLPEHLSNKLKESSKPSK